MQIHLFLSCTVLFLSVFGLKFDCSPYEKDLLKCYTDTTRLLTRDLLFPQFEELRRTEFKEKFDKCDKEFKSSFIKKCQKQNPKLKENMGIVRNSYEQGIKFLIRDDLKPLLEFYRYSDIDCIPNSYKAYDKCEEDYPLFTIMGNYSESFCSKMDKGLNCIRESLNNTYCTETVQKTYDEYYQVLKSNSPCKKEN